VPIDPRGELSQGFGAARTGHALCQASFSVTAEQFRRNGLTEVEQIGTIAGGQIPNAGLIPQDDERGLIHFRR
jgi:hypothetical protein